ncbi:alkyl hydroperoxide reductase subunit F [Acidipropionibacterium acidipropionici]|uniref:Alkyl hydroperoxide reductase subunit F n=2 Tax=Acidipropionibacterium acidipropionici TaxID=1748 RepID=A0A142KGH0_9ACTN|nr:alkyl hydroperoxide reductase subunit F [Acidipropionibacterium acidipropionici]AFV90497.1 Alkyl hydroperoxide reductase subunit F [Acidipropionibacterium acidipropionici ATCC 4875]ALN15285.1 alkyl hydroperoxide reductase subunit F [Acidipropionibacterium acidipropionici]AMS05208.1 alkyl hydroperoxide reductase subunit F [Acidipropionibacterium acidipropionici]AOZ46687.1 alkyl hydroperoxide reductase subunit F [Acidipropionibacterium acidipropionici]APZ08966.1 alkyl hydroperoxide reductase 
MLDSALTHQLADYLEMTTEPVALVPSPGEGRKSSQMMELLGEIAALSDDVTVTEPVADPRTPSFAITRPGTGISVRFAGLPMGHEFTSLVLALLQVGGVPVKEDPALIDAVRSVKGHHEFTTYMSLTCQNCPTVVQALNAMSIINPNIRHTAVEGGTFKAEVDDLGIQSVPAIHLDGREWGSGRMTMADILEKLDSSAAGQAAEDLSGRDPYDVLVVGGGPAGAAAAVYAARKGIRTAMVGDRIGGQVLDTDAIENLISVPHTTGPRLAAALGAHVAEYGVDTIERQRAEELIPAGPDGLTAVRFTGGQLRARSVILATGARWRHLGVPGEDEYRTRGVTYCPHCDGPLFAGKDVAVVGGGNSGIEAAIDLAGVARHVTVVEFLDDLKADAVLLEALGKLPNASVIASARTTRVIGDGAHVTGLEYEDRTTGRTGSLDVEGIFVQIGLLPNTEWLGDAVKLTRRGEIVVDARKATSVPGVYAAGDCTTQPYKQIIISMGAGAMASLAAFDHLIRSAGAAGTIPTPLAQAS